MGGAVSAGEDNDELIDNLVEAEYIKSPLVEKIFRAVDRGDYYLEGCKENAYRDLAWKHGHIHLSAPCIYSEVMESLKLGPGMSFLNLGSGTGYLSTMAGLLLGTYGTNHGIELHQEVVDYAKSKLEEFQNSSSAVDKYEFCPPNFVVGNCLLLDSSMHQYDRVYCGASCPTEHENYMKNLVRIGGILVMPLNDHLLQVTRTGETTFDVRSVLPVSFASLVLPDPKEGLASVKLPEMYPLTLQEVCRSAIRVILRKNIEIENPSILDKKHKPKKPRTHKRHLKRIVIPLFDQGSGELAEAEDDQEDAGIDQADSSRRPPPAHNGDSGGLNGLSSSGKSKIVLDFSLQPLRRCPETSLPTGAEGEGCSSMAGAVNEPTQNKAAHPQLDSGIDNISDDSFLEEYSSEDVDMVDEKELKDVDCGRPRNSAYLKRSAEEEDAECRLEDDSGRRTRDEQKYPHCRNSAVIFKRVAFSDADSDEFDEVDSDSGTDYFTESKPEEKSDLPLYTYYMKEKISRLPLPVPLKTFLNFSRPV